MSDAPERIWVGGNSWTDSGSWGLDKEFINDVEYIRADLATPTPAELLEQALAMPEIKALVKALKLAEELYQLGLVFAPSGLADKVVSARQSALAAVGGKP
jgi:hypothetical protein